MPPGRRCRVPGPAQGGHRSRTSASACSGSARAANSHASARRNHAHAVSPAAPPAPGAASGSRSPGTRPTTQQAGASGTVWEPSASLVRGQTMQAPAMSWHAPRQSARRNQRRRRRRCGTAAARSCATDALATSASDGRPAGRRGDRRRSLRLRLVVTALQRSSRGPSGLDPSPPAGTGVCTAPAGNLVSQAGELGRSLPGAARAACRP